jgi:urease accessory protein
MLRATTIIRRLAVKRDKIVDRVVLDHEARHKRRATLTGEGGLQFLLDLENATILDDGDALRLEDGRLVEVRAAPQRLIEITTANPGRLLRLAWHIGNRHAPAEIGEGAIYIEEDHVLLEMVRGLGATTKIVERPFRPERGAYRHEAHDYAHDHDHAHDHSHDHDHEHGHGHGHHHDH